MTAPNFLADLLRQGVQLTPEGDRLRLRAAPGALGSAELAALQLHKPEILDLLAGRTACRLTGVQDRIWFLHKLDSTGVAYTFTVAHRIDGPLDASALENALQAVVRRHAGLRATFTEVDGTPVQFIEPEPKPVLQFVDLPDASRREVDRELRAALVTPFDLERGPLLRSVLVRTGEQEHFWGLCLHHLVADGWTTGLLVEEMSGLLAGAGTTPAAGLDYTDYAEWERVRAESTTSAGNLDYWVGKLAGATPVELPLDHPRPVRRGHVGARVEFALPPELTTRLTEFGRSEAATRFASLLAVHLVLLWHCTEHEDISVGTPYANRLDPKFERTAGCFVSTLVLRAGLSSELSFREMVRRTSALCLEAWDREDYSYEKLVSEVARSRDLSRNPLFQVFFAVQDASRPLQVPGATAEPHPFDTRSVQFDLELHFHPGRQGGLLGSFHYDTALFERATIEDMAQRWQLLAASLLDSPDLPIAEFSLMSEADHRNLGARNNTASDYAREATVDRLLAEQARATAGRTALVCGGRALSYAELDRAVSALARRIGAAGGRARRAGIFLDRSAGMVIAILAAMRAGAVFVPLATDLPPERMDWIVEDTGMLMAVTSPELARDLPDRVRPLLLHDEPDAPGEPLEPTASDCPAYVLYTSGSTGKPKGVEVRHDNLVNLLHAMARKPGIGPADVVLAVTSLSFDISLLELLLPLVTGATVVVATQEEATDPARLAALLDTSGATIMQATPSTWRMLVDFGWPGLTRLTALCGGEALGRDLANRLLTACKAVWNLYGPTETTIWSARWQVDATDPVRIGEPIENTRFYVVNGRGRLVPPGVPGELCIAGDGVANGYLNRPEETERRFADLSDAGVPAERVYRTGDLVREMHDGTLAFLGRRDQQLKVRGHRVEAAEVEHALRRHPAVGDAVVTLAPEGVLVAHVAVSEGATVSAAQLRDVLAPVLPAYMVPQHFVVHAALPLTPNGKLDRKALSAIPSAAGPEETGCEPPIGATEAFLAEVYGDVLGRTGVGRHDDFFGLGGHSLLATRTLFRVKEHYGVQVALQDLFTCSTVAALAARIDSLLTRGEQDDLAIGAALDRLESMSDEEAARLLDRLG